MNCSNFCDQHWCHGISSNRRKFKRLKSALGVQENAGTRFLAPPHAGPKHCSLHNVTPMKQYQPMRCLGSDRCETKLPQNNFIYNFAWTISNARRCSSMLLFDGACDPNPGGSKVVRPPDWKSGSRTSRDRSQHNREAGCVGARPLSHPSHCYIASVQGG